MAGGASHLVSGGAGGLLGPADGAGVLVLPALGTRHERDRVCRAPLNELLVARQDGVDSLIEHVLGRLAKEVA
jgi:hypothetical protein